MSNIAHNCWRSMKERCDNPNVHNYHLYGGRGITYCEEWNKFKNFLRDMGSRPSKNHILDRIDVDGNYNKENCRWVTKRESSLNRRGSLSGTSRFKGVCYVNSKKRWVACIEYGKLKRQKHFTEEVEAAKWYNEQAKEIFGEFAYINKIPTESVGIEVGEELEEDFIE